MKKSGSSRLIQPSFRRPLFVAIGFILLYFILMLFNGGFFVNEGQIGLDMLLCLMALVFWFFFFAQFTLPLKTIQHRLEAFYRLLNYVIGTAGPAVRVENGEILERKGELQKIGPGVIIMDTASAGMIRDPAKFKGPIGPGVSFTNRFEGLAGVVDLHLQRNNFGPKENEDPFLPQGVEESDAEYKARQKRRYYTQGLTRDGIPIAPKISVAVRLNAEQDEGPTHFGYNPDAVRRAITRMPVDLDAGEDSPDKKGDITWLPLRLAADIWKECLSRYTLEELFSFEPGQETAMQRIRTELRNRMTGQRYPEVDGYGQPTGVQLHSREFNLLLARGLRINTVSITYLKMPQEVEEKLVTLWRSTWYLRALREREYVEQLRSYETEKGKRGALGRFANGTSHYLGAQNPSLRLSGEQILRQLLRGSLNLANQDSFVHRQAQDEIEQLKEMLEWSEKRSENL